MSLLLVDFNDRFFRDVARQMVKNGVAIDLLTTIYPEKYKTDSVFNQTQILHSNQYYYADEISQLNQGNRNSLSESFIQECYPAESVFLEITDRLGYTSKSVRYRKDIYYQLLLYWSSFLKDNEISQIIFCKIPHTGHENIIYFLAKKFEIQTLFVRRTLLNDNLVITNDYEMVKKVPQVFLASKSREELLDSITLDYSLSRSALMKRAHVANASIVNQSSATLWRTLLDPQAWKAVLSLLNNPFEQIDGSIFYLEKPTRWYQYYLYLAKYYLQNKQLVREYYKLSTPEVDFSQKYIYFPLHFQPERSSLPEGGVFSHLPLLLDVIAKTVPKNWKIYVKEHPKQFVRSDIRKIHARDKEYYQQLLQYKNVQLLPPETNSIKLIENAECVATVAGSSGWEAMLRGKPCLTFAYPWYAGCRSCFVVKSQAECQKALRAVKKKSPHKVEIDVLKFVAFIQDQLIDARIRYSLAILEQDRYGEMVSNLAQAYQQHLKNDQNSRKRN